MTGTKNRRPTLGCAANRCWQLKIEQTTFTRHLTTFNTYVTVKSLDDASHDRQAQTMTLDAR